MSIERFYQRAGLKTKLLMEIASALVRKKPLWARNHAQRLFNEIERSIWNRKRCECRLCGWTGNRFLDNRTSYKGQVIHNLFCPSCRSYSRYRLLQLYIEATGCLDSYKPPLIVFDFAPFGALRDYLLRYHSIRYFGFDIRPIASAVMET